MPLFLNNDEQAKCITSAMAVEAMERGVRQLAEGNATRRPRIDNWFPASRPEEFFCFSSMEGGLRDPGYYALRIKPDIVSFPIIDGRRRRVTYAYQPGLYSGLVFLYSMENAELLAILNDGFVQHERVAATAALGIRYLSNPDARVMCVLGSGGMARSFAAAAKVVRPIERVQVYSPNRTHLELYCEEMTTRLSCDVVAMSSPEAAVRDSAIVSACTNNVDGFLQPEWVGSGVHLTNVGSREIPPETRAKIEIVGYLVDRTPMSLDGYVDEDFAVRAHAMSYAAGKPEERESIPHGKTTLDPYPNARLVACCDWTDGTPYRRERPDEISTSISSSGGISSDEGGASANFQGVQFASVGGRIYERARELGLGTELPLEMFLQDIPT